MAEIKFYFNAPDRLATACSIVAKAVSQGRRVVVHAPEPQVAQRFDHMLWSLQPLSFVPHVAANSPLAARTPVVIAQTLDKLPHQDVLLNLDTEPPQGFEGFSTLVEIVSTNEADRQQARARWQAFKQQGHTPVGHDLAK